MNLLNTISQVPALIVQQRHELAELFGFETRNKYAIETNEGTLVAYAAEQGKGIWGLLLRGFLGHWRTFQITVFDSHRQPLLHLHHPFRWYFQRLEVNTADNRHLGALEKRFSILSKKFDLLDSQGRILFSVNSPIWRIWTFIFKRRETEVARVEKQWAGLLSEAFTDKDKFKITYSPAVPNADERMLLLAAGLFIDILYFERKANR